MQTHNSITGYYCQTCNNTIFSRARHDFRTCKCWQNKSKRTGVAVDGGRDYFKVSLEKHFKGEQVEIEVHLLSHELYDDWNRRYDRWGLHEGKIDRIPILADAYSKSDRPLDKAIKGKEKEYEDEIELYKTYGGD